MLLRLLPENGSSQGQNLAVTVVCVRDSPDSGQDETRDREREFFIDNLLVRIHLIIVTIR